MFARSAAAGAVDADAAPGKAAAVERGGWAARWWRGALLALLMAALGCRSAEGGGQEAPPAPAPAGPPGMTLELTPRPEQRDLLVEVRVSGPAAAEVRELHVSRAWADTRGSEAIEAIEVRDAQGEIPQGAARDDGPAREIPLGRAPTGELLVRFTARGTGSRLSLRVDRDRVSGVGHAFLVLPRIDAPLPVRVRWHLGALGPGAVGASSFGEGDAEATATSGALAHAVYAAGVMNSARAGEQRLHALGAPALGPRDILGWAGRFRTVASARLERVTAGPRDASSAAPSAAAEPLSIFLVGEPGLGQDHDGAFLGSALGLWFDGTRPLDPQLRVALAHEIVHRHLGGDLTVHEESGQPAGWFAEGFTVHYARRLLFDAGMIEAADVAADLNRMEDEASGPRAEARDPYRRGSRYAALLDHRIRKASRGARSLDDLLAALRARGAGPRPVADFRATVTAELGEEAGAEFDRLVVQRDDEIDLPGEAFGPCLRPRREQRKVFDLGFSSAVLEAGPVVIRGLKSRSAAAKAGLREGALVLEVRRIPRPEEGPESEVDMTVADRRGARRVRYKPMAIRSVGRWQTRPCASMHRAR